MSLPFDKDVLRMYMLGACEPGTSKVQYIGHNVVDLHVDDHTHSRDNIQYVLEQQLSVFEKSIDQALASGKTELRIIHGNGKGVLRKKIHQLLRQHPHVASFDDSFHPKYGYGSTIVYFF